VARRCASAEGDHKNNSENKMEIEMFAFFPLKRDAAFSAITPLFMESFKKEGRT
jgi:hypothetical protein